MNKTICSKCLNDKNTPKWKIQKLEPVSIRMQMAKCEICQKRRPCFEMGPEEIPAPVARPHIEEGDVNLFCPHCDAEIRELNFMGTQTVYGRVDIVINEDQVDTDNHEVTESGDWEVNDYDAYECPECCETVSISDIVIRKGGENND